MPGLSPHLGSFTTVKATASLSLSFICEMGCAQAKSEELLVYSRCQAWMVDSICSPELGATSIAGRSQETSRPLSLLW